MEKTTNKIQKILSKSISNSEKIKTLRNWKDSVIQKQKAESEGMNSGKLEEITNLQIKSIDDAIYKIRNKEGRIEKYQ